MAKSPKKEPSKKQEKDKKDSELFHNIMKASVSGNTTPKGKDKSGK